MANTTPINFNLRVYGLFLDSTHERILLVTETYSKGKMVKFPGGGLEFGEGTHECLVREWQEETGLRMRPGDLFYINDFFLISAFNPQEQLQSIYYFVHPEDGTYPEEWNEVEDSGRRLTFEWRTLSELRDTDLTFPADRVVIKKLRDRFL